MVVVDNIVYDSFMSLFRKDALQNFVQLYDIDYYVYKIKKEYEKCGIEINMKAEYT